jgi:single-strand DNA-binding protein
MFTQITVIGNVGRSPEIRHLENGAAVATFSVCSNERYTRNGETVERPHWFRCEVWQNGEKGLVEQVVRPYVVTGQLLMVQGQPVIDQYEKNGVTMTSFKVRLSGPGASIRLLGGRPNGKPKEAAAAAAAPDGEGTPEIGKPGEIAEPADMTKAYKPASGDDPPF